MIRLCAFADEASGSLDGQIAALKQNDISLIEVRGIDGKNVKDFTEQEAMRYAAAFRENGIGVWSVGSPLGKADIGTDFAEYLKVCEHVFGTAKIFGAKNVRVFSFFNAYHYEDEVCDRLNKMVALAADYGLTLCHENEKEIYGDTVCRVQQLLKRVPGLQSVFDSANFVEVGENAADALHALAPLTAYYHVKDVIADTQQKVPAGLGDGHIPLLIEYAAKQNAVLTLEPHLAVFEGYAAIDNTEMKGKFQYESGRAAFDAGVNALKGLLAQAGLQYIEGGYQK